MSDGSATRSPTRPPLSSRIRGSLIARHPAWLALVVFTAGVVVLLLAAWGESPSATGLDQRVDARLHAAGGKPVGLSSVASAVRDAVVATEDERFYRHQGIDVIGILRALPYDLAHLSFAQGASTITEQVAKLLYLSGNDHSPWRKLEDAAVALKLEGRYDKEQILAAYLNSVYFGHGAYGLWAASHRYFGIAPSSLDIAEASMLAGLIQAPSEYDPYLAPSVARARQVEVLRSMVADGFLTQGQAAEALAKPLRLRGGPTLPPIHGVGLAPGPAFAWRELALGTAVTLTATVALVASRLPRFRVVHAIVAVRLASVTLGLVGAALIVRSFRTA